jgi:hypothetical protein
MRSGIEIRIIEGKDDTSTSLGLTTVGFPFEAQHRVLLRVQQLLEEACFRFMEMWLPSMLAQHEWTCAAAIELTKSLTVIKTNLDILPADCMDAPTQTLFIEIAPHVAQLRHAAVHRLHLKHDEFLQRINCAHKLAGILHDLERTNTLQALCTQADALTKKLEYETRIVKQKADCILSELSQQRAGIAQKEQQLRDTVAHKRSELAAAAGRAILEPIEALSFTSDSKGANRRGESHDTIEPDACLDEDDIESDEDRLRAELG